MEQLLDDAARRLRASIEPLAPTIDLQAIDDALARLAEELPPHLERVVVSTSAADFADVLGKIVRNSVAPIFDQCVELAPSAAQQLRVAQAAQAHALAADVLCHGWQRAAQLTEGVLNDAVGRPRRRRAAAARALL